MLSQTESQTKIAILCIFLKIISIFFQSNMSILRQIKLA